MPHNSAVVMWAGCQERYKHSVPAMPKGVGTHPMAGEVLPLTRCTMGLPQARLGFDTDFSSSGSIARTHPSRRRLARCQRSASRWCRLEKLGLSPLSSFIGFRAERKVFDEVFVERTMRWQARYRCHRSVQRCVGWLCWFWSVLHANLGATTCWLKCRPCTC